MRSGARRRGALTSLLSGRRLRDKRTLVGPSPPTTGGCTMMKNLPAVPDDLTPFAMAAFLARYREPTVRAYRRDLRCFWSWCTEHHLAPLRARRPPLELYLRDLERRGYAPAGRCTRPVEPPPAPTSTGGLGPTAAADRPEPALAARYAAGLSPPTTCGRSGRPHQASPLRSSRVTSTDGSGTTDGSRRRTISPLCSSSGPTPCAVRVYETPRQRFHPSAS